MNDKLEFYFDFAVRSLPLTLQAAHFRCRSRAKFGFGKYTFDGHIEIDVFVWPLVIIKGLFNGVGRHWRDMLTTHAKTALGL